MIGGDNGENWTNGSCVQDECWAS